jgi:uncharacterized protein YebE (UPF0316 family)
MADIILSSLIIFLLRCTDITFYTIRILMVMRGQKLLAWFLGFCQSIVFITALQRVVSGAHTTWYLGAYAAGFATGQVVGMSVEERLGMGFLHMRIVSVCLGEEIAHQLRLAGFGVTEIFAKGRDGAVELLHCNILRREKERAEAIIAAIDPNAFITAENVRQLQSGFFKEPSM